MERETTWKVCPMAEFFEISTAGEVRNIKSRHILKPCDNGTGYQYVTKVLDGKKKHFYIHRLVASTYHENPNGLPEVNHKDGNKHNNRADNLEWCTRSENHFHAFRTGLQVPSEKQRRVARETAIKALPAMHEGWKRWYATEEGRAKHAQNARENLRKHMERRRT